MRLIAALLVTIPLVAALSACEEAPDGREHVTSTGVTMKPYVAIPPGTAPRGTAAYRAALAPPGPTVSPAVLQRGQERFEAFCVPCHGTRGHGDGPVVQRGHPAPPSYHIERLRAAEPAYLVEVITEGRGAMWPYAERILPEDRWAIAAYVKALQMTEGATDGTAGDSGESGASPPPAGADRP